MDKYILLNNGKVYNEEMNEFVADKSKATEYSTLQEASKKKHKLKNKVFGNISFKVVKENT